jgi:hypothetical protein
MSEAETCESCRFWAAAWRFKKHLGPDPNTDVTPLELPQGQGGGLMRKKAERGQCRRYAPRASALTTVWMDTRAWDWCGDYQPLIGDGRHAAEPASAPPVVAPGSDAAD